MATLNSSNIVNGNIVETTDILQLYDALTAGGGTTGVYDVSISGSLTGSATTALNASKLNPISDTSNNNRPVVFISTSSADYEQTYKANDGKFTYNPSTNLLNVTSSRAVTASFALNAVASSPSTVLVNTTATNQNLKPFAGQGTFSSGILNVDMNITFPDLNPSALGTDLFLTATAASNTEYVGMSFAGNTLTFRSSLGAGSSGTFYYVGWCK